jgi:predicted transcriptional regulator
MTRKAIKIGIMPLKDYQERTIAIARGEYKPRKDEPKIWFASLKALGEVMNNRNQELLRVIVRHEPDSLKELAELTGRQVSNLSRTLSTMERIGLVKLTRNGRRIQPAVVATDFTVEFGISDAPAAGSNK